MHGEGLHRCRCFGMACWAVGAPLCMGSGTESPLLLPGLRWSEPGGGASQSAQNPRIDDASSCTCAGLAITVSTGAGLTIPGEGEDALMEAPLMLMYQVSRSWRYTGDLLEVYLAAYHVSTFWRSALLCIGSAVGDDTGTGGLRSNGLWQLARISRQ